MGERLANGLIEPIMELVNGEAEQCRKSQSLLYQDIERLNAELQMFMEVCPGTVEQINLISQYLADLDRAKKRLIAIVSRLQVIAKRIE